MGTARVSIVKASEIKGNEEFMGGKFVRYDEDVTAIKTAVKKAIELAVGSIDAIIKPGDRVLVKPNLAFQAPPESFAVVDPRTVE
ncbi:MAG: FeS-binding protein, partial [Acetomicrobium sp.]